MIASFTILQKESERIQTIVFSTQTEVHEKWTIFNHQIKTNRSFSTDRSHFSSLHYIHACKNKKSMQTIPFYTKLNLINQANNLKFNSQPLDSIHLFLNIHNTCHCILPLFSKFRQTFQYNLSLYRISSHDANAKSNLLPP